MSSDISENNPKKETLYALGGVGLFLAIVLLIGISAFLRPAGEHIKAEPAADEAVAEAPAETAAAPAAEAEATAEAPATDDTMAVTEEVSTTPAADAPATDTAAPAEAAPADTATATAEAPAAETAPTEADNATGETDTVPATVKQ